MVQVQNPSPEKKAPSVDAKDVQMLLEMSDDIEKIEKEARDLKRQYQQLKESGKLEIFPEGEISKINEMLSDPKISKEDKYKDFRRLLNEALEILGEKPETDAAKARKEVKKTLKPKERPGTKKKIEAKDQMTFEEFGARLSVLEFESNDRLLRYAQRLIQNIEKLGLKIGPEEGIPSNLEPLQEKIVKIRERIQKNPKAKNLAKLFKTKLSEALAGKVNANQLIMRFNALQKENEEKRLRQEAIMLIGFLEGKELLINESQDVYDTTQSISEASKELFEHLSKKLGHTKLANQLYGIVEKLIEKKLSEEPASRLGLELESGKLADAIRNLFHIEEENKQLIAIKAIQESMEREFFKPRDISYEELANLERLQLQIDHMAENEALKIAIRKLIMKARELKKKDDQAIEKKDPLWIDIEEEQNTERLAQKILSSEKKEIKRAHKFLWERYQEFFEKEHFEIRDDFINRDDILPPLEGEKHLVPKSKIAKGIKKNPILKAVFQPNLTKKDLIKVILNEPLIETVLALESLQLDEKKVISAAHKLESVIWFHAHEYLKEKRPAPEKKKLTAGTLTPKQATELWEPFVPEKEIPAQVKSFHQIPKNFYSNLNSLAESSLDKEQSWLLRKAYDALDPALTEEFIPGIGNTQERLRDFFLKTYNNSLSEEIDLSNIKAYLSPLKKILPPLKT